MEESKQIIENVSKTKVATDFTEEQWKVAMDRYHIIEPIINNKPEVSVASIARKENIHRATLFRWIRKFAKGVTPLWI